MLEFEELKKLVAEAEDDVAKAEGGNKAAGTRVRKSMQDIKNAAQVVRKKVLELRSEGEAQEPTPPAPTA
ncbi:MAG: histone H1 [Phycisphaerae bacterium]|nr:histone H1 [Phycisphaerae bacterium]